MCALRCPALLVAAPASGQGKTTVVAGLARLLTRRGLRVRVFKCGPDFIDPFWHALASGAPVDNLDLWMTGETDIRLRLHAAAQAADVILIESVMGLHDGAPSSADLARLLDLPVLLVLRADAMAQTAGAVAHGLRTWRAGDQPLRWAGVLANGVASAGHARLLEEALEPESPWLGAVAPSDALRLPERPLGLTPAQDLTPAKALGHLDAMADALAATPLGALTPAGWQSRWPVDFAAPPTPAWPPLLSGRTIAIARDTAFCFLYPANLDTLQALGARLVFFSPLAGDSLPPCDALWLPGGYPERHAARLSCRRALRQQVAAHHAAGKPLWAEGGGMLILARTLMDADGKRHAGWDLLAAEARMQPHLSGLGLQSWRPADMPTDIPALRGHCFHYATVHADTPPAAYTVLKPGSVREQGEPLHIQGALRASFFHPYFASSPRVAASLFLP